MPSVCRSGKPQDDVGWVLMLSPACPTKEMMQPCLIYLHVIT